MCAYAIFLGNTLLCTIGTCAVNNANMVSEIQPILGFSTQNL